MKCLMIILVSFVILFGAGCANLGGTKANSPYTNAANERMDEKQKAAKEQRIKNEELGRKKFEENKKKVQAEKEAKQAKEKKLKKSDNDELSFWDKLCALFD